MSKYLTSFQLKNKINECQANIEDFELALQYLPSSSFLGYLSIAMSIKKEKAILDKLLQEKNRRLKAGEIDEDCNDIL